SHDGLQNDPLAVTDGGRKTEMKTFKEFLADGEAEIAVRTSRLSCGKAEKARIFTPVWDSSGESRLISVLRCIRTRRRLPAHYVRSGTRKGWDCCAVSAFCPDGKRAHQH